MAGSGCLDVATCCDYKCAICHGAVATCVTCSDVNRSLPTCNCDATFYDDGLSNPICLSCVYPCIECTSASTCSTCINSVANRLTFPSCHCDTGFYNDGSDIC